MLPNLLSPRPSGRFVLGGLCVLSSLTLLAADRSFTPYAAVKTLPVPRELQHANETQWIAWARRHDKAIRSRLQQGDLDSLVNLLLFGTSFTTQPRVHIETLGEASKSGVLRARVDDLVDGFHNPGNNPRLQSLQHLVPDDPADAGKFIYSQLLRVLQERQALAARATAQTPPERSGDPISLLGRASYFRDRGVSLDTGIIPSFTVEQTLRELKNRGVLQEGRVARVAVIGPGLDFIDKNEESAYDYYPPQTLQPFALYDSLLRLRLAATLSLSVLDISPRVLDHLQRARARATANSGYVLQLPRDVSRPWPPDLIAYWNAFGDQIAMTVPPLHPPAIFPGLPARAVQVRSDIVRACEPVDLDIIVQRLTLAPQDRFDLIVATNIFVYYDAFEQGLALENVAAMLKPGGLLLTNDRVPETAASFLGLGGVTVVPFDSPGISARLAVGWYQKR